jgi:DNA-binding winged helix-turn-helix (wHTH) protein/tetratricopeptide (TPR) repeat protein
VEIAPTTVQFGRFELDLARAELCHDGAPVELSAKPLSLLIHLAVHRDRVISKQELFDELWPDVVVGEAALSSALKDLRRALGDDGSQMRYIRTYRRRGYRFVAASRPTAPTSDAPADARPSAPKMVLRDRAEQQTWYRPPRVEERRPPIPFVGREDERGALVEALREAEAGHPRFRLIEGDAGSGKSRLVEEFVSSDCQFVDVAAGRARDDNVRPYLAFAEALTTWILEHEVGSEDRIGNDLKSVALLLFPSQCNESGEWRSRLLGERERNELFSSVSRLVISLARRQPVVLVLEDLQFADVSTLSLLEHLTSVVREAAEDAPVPLLVVGTAQRDRRPEIDAQLEQILSEPHSDRIELSSLGDGEVAEILDVLGFENPPARWVSRITELSDGNPLFVFELARHLEEYGERGLALPQNLEAAMLRRLSKLGEECRHLLTVAARIGDSFGLLALSAACARSETETRKLLDEAVAAGIVSGTSRAFRFEQPSWAHLLKSLPGDAERRAIHARIADVLEDLYASAGGEHAIEIANHLLAASSLVGAERLLHYCRQAGVQALAMYAWREAGRFFAAAADAATNASESDRAGLHLRAGIAFNHDWDAESCVRHYESAAAGYRRCGDDEGLAWALMYLTRARLTMASATYGEKLDVDELGRIAEGFRTSAPALRAMLLELHSEVEWMAGASQRARRMAEDALVIGHNLESDEVCHRACMGLALAHFQSLHIREALESWRQARRHGRALAASWLQAPAAVREAMSLVLLGRFDEADAALDDALAHASRAHNVGELSFASAHRAVLRAGRGEAEAALKAAAESFRTMRRSRYPWGGPFAATARLAAHVLRGDFETAREGLRELAQPGVVFDEPGPAVLLLAAVSELWVDALSGREVAAERLAGIVSHVAAAGHDAYLLGPVCALVDIAERSRRVDLVLRLEPLLRLALDRGVRFSTTWVFSIDRMLAAIESERGESERALRSLESSIEMAARANALPELAHAHAMMARMVDVDRSAAERSSLAHRRAGLSIAQSLGSPTVLEYCRDRSEHRAAPAPESPPHHTHGTQQRGV